VVALASNPEFIDAFLLGLNAQFKSELHWRQLADAPTATAFSLFWGTVSDAAALARRTPDIRPFADWPDAPLGDPAHQYVAPGDTQGHRDLVIVFRTDLFRRYPTTQVYLRRIPTNPADEAAALQKAPTFPADPTGPDRSPIFQGSLASDVVFFIFDVAPEDLGKYWVMLEEPPAELRFVQKQAATSTATTSAQYAKDALDHPTRVAISWTDMGGGI
jgi:hypothetical protein